MSYVDAIFLSGIGSYVEALSNIARFPDELLNGFAWTFAVFTVHELQRYLNVKEWILSDTKRWGLVCLFMFWLVFSLGISGPQFIYYQF